MISSVHSNRFTLLVFWGKKLNLKTRKWSRVSAPVRLRIKYFNVIIYISYESVADQSGPCVAGSETSGRWNYLREGMGSTQVPGVPIKGRTIWVIGSTLVVFIIVPRRDIEIFIKNKQCQQCQPAASQPVTWIELLETIFFSWSKMTICLINFPTKKLPVKVPSIVTILSYSSLHWTLSLLSKSCDKVKFKHPDLVEKFAMTGGWDCNW